MPHKIDKLTPEQEATFPRYVQEWTSYGLSTEPANRGLAREGIQIMYSQEGLTVPPIYWTGSPFANPILKTSLDHLNSLPEEERRNWVVSALRMAYEQRHKRTCRSAFGAGPRATIVQTIANHVLPLVPAGSQPTLEQTLRAAAHQTRGE